MTHEQLLRNEIGKLRHELANQTLARKNIEQAFLSLQADKMILTQAMDKIASKTSEPGIACIVLEAAATIRKDKTPRGNIGG